MRYLGIDFGLKRVGLAVTDPDGRLAFPYATLVKKETATFFRDLLAIVDHENIEAIVVGLPRSLDGEETLRSRQVHNFVQRLKRRTRLPVLLADERLSSREAEDRLQAAGLPPEKRKAARDQEAAVIILERYLSRSG